MSQHLFLLTLFFWKKDEKNKKIKHRK